MTETDDAEYRQAEKEHQAATLIQGQIQAHLDKKALNKAVQYAAAVVIQNAWRDSRDRKQQQK